MKNGLEPDAIALRELRFLLSSPDRTLRRLFTVKFARDDCSFYLFPHSSKDEYYFGVEKFPAGERLNHPAFAGDSIS